VLPNFLIIGAEKAATTWLARGLAEHPAIFLPAEKELFYFSSRYDRGRDWYADHFRDASGHVRVGEATPVYLSHPGTPGRIRETLGEVDLGTFFNLASGQKSRIVGRLRAVQPWPR